MARILYAAVGAVLLSACGSEPDGAKPTTKGAERSPGPQADTAAQSSTGDASQPAGLVELDALTLTAPRGWIRKPASSGFVVAEFTLPKTDGDEWDGRLTVSSAGGEIEANIDRWRGQFGGKPSNEARRKIEADELDITVVDLSGDYSDQRGPLAPTVNRPSARMLAAIIPLSGRLYFIKAVGPEKTMAANVDEFDAFVSSVKRK